MHRPDGEDRGETLVELIVAIAIMGIGAVAVLTGFEFAVVSSDLGRKQATGDAYVRSLAEAIQESAGTSGGYQPCAAANAYLTAAVTSRAGLPSGYTATQSAAQSWNGTSWTSCSSDSGTQRVVLTVTSPGTGVHQATEQLTAMIRKPCNGSLPTPC